MLKPYSIVVALNRGDAIRASSEAGNVFIIKYYALPNEFGVTADMYSYQFIPAGKTEPKITNFSPGKLADMIDTLYSHFGEGRAEIVDIVKELERASNMQEPNVKDMLNIVFSQTSFTMKGS